MTSEIKEICTTDDTDGPKTADEFKKISTPSDEDKTDVDDLDYPQKLDTNKIREIKEICTTDDADGPRTADEFKKIFTFSDEDKTDINDLDYPQNKKRKVSTRRKKLENTNKIKDIKEICTTDKDKTDTDDSNYPKNKKKKVSSRRKNLEEPFKIKEIKEICTTDDTDGPNTSEEFKKIFTFSDEDKTDLDYPQKIDPKTIKAIKEICTNDTDGPKTSEDFKKIITFSDEDKTDIDDDDPQNKKKRVNPRTKKLEDPIKIKEIKEICTTDDTDGPKTSEEFKKIFTFSDEDKTDLDYPQKIDPNTIKAIKGICTDDDTDGPKSSEEFKKLFTFSDEDKTDTDNLDYRQNKKRRVSTRRKKLKDPNTIKAIKEICTDDDTDGPKTSEEFKKIFTFSDEDKTDLDYPEKIDPNTIKAIKGNCTNDDTNGPKTSEEFQKIFTFSDEDKTDVDDLDYPRNKKRRVSARRKKLEDANKIKNMKEISTTDEDKTDTDDSDYPKNKKKKVSTRRKKLEDPDRINKKLQIEEKKRLLQEQRVMKKLEKEQERAKKLLNRDIKRSTSKVHCIEYVTVNLEESVEQENYGKLIKAALTQNNISYKVVKSEPGVIFWSRKVLSEDTSSQENIIDEKHFLVILPLTMFASLVKDDTLKDHIAMLLQKLNFKHLTIVVFGLEWPTRDQELAVMKVERLFKCYWNYVVKGADLTAFILRATKALAQIPHSMEQEKYQLQYFDDSNRSKVKVDKDGNGLARLWKQMITVFPGVRLDTAEAITSKYPTLSSLYKAYKQCDNKETLIQDMPRRIPHGTSTSSKRIGPELSKKFAKFFTSEDNILL